MIHSAAGCGLPTSNRNGSERPDKRFRQETLLGPAAAERAGTNNQLPACLLPDVGGVGAGSLYGVRVGGVFRVRLKGWWSSPLWWCMVTRGHVQSLLLFRYPSCGNFPQPCMHAVILVRTLSLYLVAGGEVCVQVQAHRSEGGLRPLRISFSGEFLEN